MAPHFTMLCRLRLSRWIISGIMNAAAPARRMPLRKVMRLAEFPSLNAFDRQVLIQVRPVQGPRQQFDMIELLRRPF